MDEDRSAQSRDHREFNADAWVGEPDNRTHQDFMKARGMVALASFAILLGGIALAALLALILAFMKLIQ